MCPFAEQFITIPKTHVDNYIKEQARDFTLEELRIIYHKEKHQSVKEALQKVMLNFHGTTVQ